MVNKYKMLCAHSVHSSPQALAGEIRRGVPVRPQFLSGAAVTCLFTVGPLRPLRTLTEAPSSVCRC